MKRLENHKKYCVENGAYHYTATGQCTQCGLIVSKPMKRIKKEVEKPNKGLTLDELNKVFNKLEKDTCKKCRYYGECVCSPKPTKIEKIDLREAMYLNDVDLPRDIRWIVFEVEDKVNELVDEINKLKLSH